MTDHGQKEKGCSKISARRWLLDLHLQCPESLHSLEGNGLLQRGQLERYQQDKVLGPGDESTADCAGDD